MSTKEQKLLLYTEDVAELLGTTPVQVRNMRARGQLPAPHKIPGLGMCWTRKPIEVWLEKQTRQASYPESLPGAHIPNGAKGPYFKAPR